MGSRIKKYRMKAIPSAFSEKGGFSAQFIGDGYSVDARTEILPAVIRASGVQVGEGTAWELVTAFLKACAQRAANTGETVNVGSLLTFGLAIKGANLTDGELAELGLRRAETQTMKLTAAA